MARTPLLRILRRVVLQHRAARAMGLAPDAIPDLRDRARDELQRGPSISRRAFVGGLGAGALALAGGEARAAGAPRVAIVGAGIAGLTCALELADRGVASTVYEAADRVGGRMFSNPRYFDQGQVAEWCGELLDTDNRVLFALARRFGLVVDDLDAGSPPGSEETYFFEKSYYPAAQAALDFAPVCAALAADIRAAGPCTSRLLSTRAGRALDAMSVHDWIETRVPGGHRSLLGRLLDVAYVIEFGAPTADQSALNVVYFLGAPRACPAGPLELFGISDERFHVRGGNERIPHAIARSLGDAVRTGHRLVRLRKTPAGRTELTFAAHGSTFETTADVVVLALPFAVLRGLDWREAGFDAHKARAIRELGRARNGKTQIQLTDRLWRRAGPWPGLSNGSSYADTGYQNTWEVSRAQPGACGILVAYSGGPVTISLTSTTPFATVANPAVLADARAMLARIDPVYPGISARWNAKATQSIPHLSDLRGASYSYRRVGQYTAFGGDEGARQGNVFFCGEHTAFDHQGHMEGAAAEGVRVAREIARELGAPAFVRPPAAAPRRGSPT